MYKHVCVCVHVCEHVCVACGETEYYADKLELSSLDHFFQAVLYLLKLKPLFTLKMLPLFSFLKETIFNFNCHFNVKFVFMFFLNLF